MARRGRGTAADRTADRAVAPDGVEGAPNGVEPPGARTMGAIAVARWAARSPGEPSEGPDEGGTLLTQGPYDDGDLDPEQTEADRVDFGAVRIPVPRGGQVSVEPEAGRLQAVHVMLPMGRLSVSALAAPRSARLWPDLAAEIDESLREGGATVRSFTGPWGRELHARTGEASSVFVGVDGPRWMLYGVATGPTGAARELDSALRRMLRGVVVVRGRAPYPVRTVLPLTVPEHLAAAEPEPAEAERPPAARNGRFPRRPQAPGRPGSAGAAEMPVRPRDTPAQVPPPPPGPAPLSAPMPAPVPAASSVPDPGGIPTEPYGLRPVASPGTNGHAGGGPPRRNGASAPRQHPDAAALRPPLLHRDPSPPTHGRTPAERPDQDPTSTGQRRVADLLAQAQRERAAQEAQRERAAEEAREARRREAQQREARERAEREARERAAQERAALEAQRERAAQEARDRAAAQRPAAYGSAWSPARPATPGPGLLGGPVNGRRHDDHGDHRNGGRWDGPHDDRHDDRHDDIPLRLGGAPRELGPGGSGVSGAGQPRHDPARPASDGSDDWTLPLPVVPPEPGRAYEAPQGRAEDDLWAGDPWAAETRRAARAGRAAERRQEGPSPADGRGHPAPDPERSAHQRSAHHRAAHQRPSHERPGDPPVDVPSARVPPPPVAPAWAHRRDDRADPYDGPGSGRHRRPER